MHACRETERKIVFECDLYTRFMCIFIRLELLACNTYIGSTYSETNRSCVIQVVWIKFASQPSNSQSGMIVWLREPDIPFMRIGLSAFQFSKATVLWQKYHRENFTYKILTHIQLHSSKLPSAQTSWIYFESLPFVGTSRMWQKKKNLPTHSNVKFRVSKASFRNVLSHLRYSNTSTIAYTCKWLRAHKIVQPHSHIQTYEAYAYTDTIRHQEIKPYQTID